MGNFSKTDVSEDDLIRIARYVCMHSPGNILLIGGGCVLGETAGYRRMRSLSDDLDFIVNDEGLEAVREPLKLGDKYRNGEKADGGNVNYINDVLVGFFHKEIRGWKIPDKVFQQPRIKYTSAGEIYMIPAELNIALKIRRGASREENPHIYGKDALDAATIFLGMERQSEHFDSKQLILHLLGGVCSDCKLTGQRACVNSLSRSEKQLFNEDRERYHDFVSSCADSLKGICRKATV